MDGKLDIGVGVLHAQRGPVDAHEAQRFDLLDGQPARIDLHAELHVRIELEIGGDQPAEPGQFLRRKEGRRPAAEVNLGDLPARS